MSKRKMFWTAGISGAIGAGFGAASGSNLISVVMIVGAVIALLVAWTLDGFLR